MRVRFVLISLYLAFAASLNAEQVPGVVIDHQDAATGQYLSSPSIVIAPNGTYVVSHDYFGPNSGAATSAESKIFVSEDHGSSWKAVADFRDQYWSNLFVLKGRIYLMGTTGEFGRIVLRASDDNGRTWSPANYLTKTSGYHTNAVPVVVHKGRIYRAFEFHPDGPWGRFQEFVMSAPIDSDLTKAENWSFSERLSFPVGEQGNTWLEGNLVLRQDGSIVDIMRVNDQQHVAMLKFDGTNLNLDRFIDFPGGATKFVIRFDPVSKLYWTLSNPALPGEELSVIQPSHVRNTLVLMSSPDLVHWTPRSIVLHHPDTKFHAFQYVDWQFEGKDIIAVSRTAFDDAAGGAHSFHDSNYITFHRIPSFRKTGYVKLTGRPFPTAEVYSTERIESWAGYTTTFASQNHDGIYSQPVGRYNTHNTSLTTRVKTGEAELHHSWSDIFVIVAGEGSLVSGGHLDNSHVIAPGEVRGSAIVDGTTQLLKPGTIVHIDADLPHQLIVPPGKAISYFVVKVKGV